MLISLLVLSYIFWCQNYSFNVTKCVTHATNNALPKSHTCCAWYVMCALQSGGCPIPIAPAFAYKQILPKYGFIEVSDTIQYGDIIVFPRVKNHPFGHIAIWDGNQWISDFKQKSMFPAKAYRNTKYVIYRHQALVS